MTPVLDVALFTSLKARGCVPSANSFLPPPSVIGKIMRRNSSTRSYSRRVWMRFALPCTCSSGPSSSFSFCISSTTLPIMVVVLFHESARGTYDTTYFLAALCSSAEEKREWLCIRFSHKFHHGLIEVIYCPPTIAEATSLVFMWPARRLHNTIERYK